MRAPAAAFFVALSLLALSPSARAEWAILTESVPIERLIENLSQRVKDHPRDAAVHFALARVHSLAFAAHGQTTLVSLEEEDKDKLPGELPWDSVVLWPSGDEITKGGITHYHQSVHHYRQAVRFEPDHARAWLGLGYLLHRGAEHALAIGRPDGAELKSSLSPEEIGRYRAWLVELGSEDDAVRDAATKGLRDALPRSSVVLVQGRRDGGERQAEALRTILAHWYRSMAREALERVVELRFEADAAREEAYVGGDELLADEAARYLIELTELEPPSEERDQRLAKLREQRASLARVPRWETPIVFPLDRPRPLVELLPAGRSASFDLDGDGVLGHWPWVSADTGLLVWDPDGDGSVNSGQDLFGTRTWWIGWRDGYAALDALDDDGDDLLTGAELDGLAVWVDRDGDAVSDPGEVRPMHELGLLAITTRPDARREPSALDARAPAIASARAGLLRTDGSRLPTYDWTPQRLAPPSD